jgi:hypothetical protein
MSLFITFTLTLILVVNAILWWLYRRDLLNKIRTQKQSLNNAYAYIDELQNRCERYRTAMLTEALAAQTRTEPVVKVYPVGRLNVPWIIETHLN